MEARRMNFIAGIDPGMTGAVAVFHGGKLERVEDMPTYDGAVDGLELAALLEGVDYAYIENQHPMPRNGSIASFKLGMNFGIGLAILSQLAISTRRIPASRWKSYNGLIGKNKDASLLLARELWPEHRDRFRNKAHHNRAEACLIGRYGVYRQITEGVEELIPDAAEAASVSDLSRHRATHPSRGGS
jgi:crossover junction endodeoxyribonuclease RuvC